MLQLLSSEGVERVVYVAGKQVARRRMTNKEGAVGGG